MSGDEINTSRTLPHRGRPAGRAARLTVALSLGAIGLALASIPVAIADPADNHPQPDDDKAATAAQTLLAERPGDGPRAGARARDGRPSTAPAIDPATIPWDEIAAFMRQHSPLKWDRWEQFNRLASAGPARGGFDRSEMRQRLEDGIRSQYAQLKKIESADPEEYKLEVRRVEIEDRMFGANADFRRGVGDVAKQALATQQMKQHARDLFILRDELQKHRLERRKAELVRQSEQVDRQLAAVNEKISNGPKDAAVTNLANRLLHEQPGPLYDGARGGPRSSQPRRDGAPPDGRDPRSGHLPPSTNPSSAGDSTQAEKSPAPAGQK